MAQGSREHRKYFRMDDKVQLRVRRLSEEEYRRLVKDGSIPLSDIPDVASQLSALSSRIGSTLRALRKTDPDVAQCLQLLDEKVEILARQVKHAGDEGMPNAEVNLGTGGMAFWSDSPLSLETKLEVTFTIYPSLLQITAVGQVVHEEADSPTGRRFRIGMEFSRIGETEQESLARHLIELQSSQLRRLRDH